MGMRCKTTMLPLVTEIWELCCEENIFFTMAWQPRNKRVHAKADYYSKMEDDSSWDISYWAFSMILQTFHVSASDMELDPFS